MLKTELRDSIRILTLDRPNKSNSLHPDLISSLEAVKSYIERLRKKRRGGAGGP